MISAVLRAGNCRVVLFRTETADVGLLACSLQSPSSGLRSGARLLGESAVAVRSATPSATRHALAVLQRLGLVVLGAAVGPAAVFTSSYCCARQASRRLPRVGPVLVFPAYGPDGTACSR